jgi:hypothetical protein
MRTDLNKLAAELAGMDCPKGRNIDVVAVRTALAALGRKLRQATPEELVAIIGAIMARAGRRAKGGVKC